MQTDEPCKIGNLYSSSQTKFLKKSWIKRFYALYKSSNHGIQRLEVFDTENNFLKQSTPVKIITLTDCIKVTAAPQKQQSNVFEVRTKTHGYLLSADTFQEMTEWLSSLQNVAFGTNQSTSNGAGSHSLDQISAEPKIRHEENMLYSSVDGPEIYVVKISETEATLRCNLKGTYNLVLTQVGISLTECNNTPKPVLTWSYRHIRRYGFGSDSFFFEAGRKSPSGEGLFKLETKDGNAIFQSMAALANQLKSSKSENNLSSSPLGEPKTFFPSRPAVPETNTPTSRDFKRSDSDALSADEDGSYATIKPRTQVAKPPRRSKMKPESVYGNLQAKTETPKDNFYENPGDIQDPLPPSPLAREPLYDEPQELQDAWRTHGRDVEDNYLNSANRQQQSAPLYEDIADDEIGCCVDTLANSLDKISTIKRKEEEEAARFGNSYDHLKFKQAQQSKVSNNNGTDHVYGKLNCKGVEKPGQNEGDSKHMSSPGYANVIGSSEKTTRTKVRIDSEDESQTPHFTANDAVYAQIIKKNKK